MPNELVDDVSDELVEKTWPWAYEYFVVWRGYRLVYEVGKNKTIDVKLPGGKSVPFDNLPGARYPLYLRRPWYRPDESQG